MVGALWILAVTIIVGILLFLSDRIFRRKGEAGDAITDASGDIVGGNNPEDPSEKSEEAASKETEIASGSEGNEECCGMHIVCEKDTLSPFTDEVIYYDDEELDRFKGRDPSGYTPDEVEEFRDVLMTLLPSDIPGWARSIAVRRIELPFELRDELLMLVNEQRGH